MTSTLTHPGACGGTITETWTIPSAQNCNRGDIVATRMITVLPTPPPTVQNVPGPTTIACGDALVGTTLPYSNGLSGNCELSGTTTNPSTFSAHPGACGGTITETWTILSSQNCNRGDITATTGRSPFCRPTRPHL